MLTMRRGVTLIELLVASAVFTIGFVAIYGLMAVGMRHRALADRLARCAVAASSLQAEMRLRAGSEHAAPWAPQLYVGAGGLLSDGHEGSDVPGRFYPWPDQPGILYRIEQAQDLSGDANNRFTDTLRYHVLVAFLGNQVPPGAAYPHGMELAELARRLGLRPGADPGLGPGFTVSDPDALLAELRRRQLVFRHVGVVHRRPSWR